ncbi:pol II transcription elongation factor [Collybia nuda]|uniref:Elongator complex protein 1 n=1 Tax=Collybia nuda TaxID=64659 RepID=A0A9P5Y939_9AGAR|nr:pol II transcription elongation factor [Collybia nuda]
MRNLTLAASTLTVIQNANVTATTIDLDENVIYATSERQNLDGEVEVEIWKVDSDETSRPSLFAIFSTVASSEGSVTHQVVSLRVLPDTRRLSVIMRGGDITMVAIDEEPTVDVEGTVEPGILAASWSPDDSLLVVITGEAKLILMTSTFDVLSENPLHATEFGEDAQINVGWGSKQTQFHGSLGKAAAQAPAISNVGSSPDDDLIPRVSWRGDGAFFVVSALSPAGESFRRRILRVYDRNAALQSTSEDIPGLEHNLVWRPSGNLIVGTQRFGFEGGGAGREGRHDVVFFERNGLRHGEFSIRAEDLTPITKKSDGRKWGYKVRELSWSSDSNVLGIWIEGDEGDIVQLWIMGNYYWYLKQEILAPTYSSDQPGRFTSVAWHPEQALHLMLTTPTEIIRRTYEWDVFASISQPPIDSGAVAVLDGSNILLTPFRVQNIPPPMSSCKLTLTSRESTTSKRLGTPIHASFSSTSDLLAILWESGRAELWSLHTRLQVGRGKVMGPSMVWSGQVGGGDARQYRQIHVSSADALGASTSLVVLSTDRGSDILTVLDLADFKPPKDVNTLPLPYRNCRLVTEDRKITCQGPGGEILQYNAEENRVLPVARFPEFCFYSRGIPSSSSEGVEEVPPVVVYIGLGRSGKLHISNEKSTHILAHNTTSFTVASGFVIFTSTTHEATFVPIQSFHMFLNTSNEGLKPSTTDWEVRRVERGSRIVTAVPSSMSLVLQMPRGNLETINPRPLVMEVVKQDLNAGNYRKAFFACRKHRIDLNVLVDHDQETFLTRISSFVEQIHEVDHINLLLAGLGRGSQPPETIAKLCDAIRVELEAKDLKKYVNSILTAYVVKTPPDHESGLAILLRLRETDPDLVEDAVKYIIFLVDADRLFDTALGMYDFSLVLMIAQYAQKDPREYLPFLRELRALDKYHQRFRIDDHLKRYSSALRNLSLAGPDFFADATAYVELHRLHEEALKIWKNTEHYNAVLELYGDWLFERRDFRQAASIFIKAQNDPKAMVSHEKALEWQELFDLAVRVGMPGDEVVSTAYRIAEDLGSKKRHSEAARVLLDYAKDIREAVIALVQGNLFSEARRIVTMTNKPELLENIIHPGALESCAQIMEDVNECKEQLRKQVNRLRELRIKKVEEPDAFYGIEDAVLHNVDVMTDVSMPASAFTRYTIAPTSVSKTSKRSSRSKRKMERKVGSGRKGTVDEEEYLLKSVTKLVGRFITVQDEARGLLPHLFQFTPEHYQDGLSMQQHLARFSTELEEGLEEIWKKPAEENPVDSWASRMEEAENNKRVNPIDKVLKPDLPSNSTWRMNLFDTE